MPKSHRSFKDVEVDAHVGGRVCIRRTLLGLNQTQVGEALGISFQQVQKNENGSNRIGASRLYHLSKILDVPVSYFYEDMPEELGEAPQPAKRPSREERERDIMQKRETLELVRAYYRIEDAEVRQRLRETVRELAGERQRK